MNPNLPKSAPPGASQEAPAGLTRRTLLSAAIALPAAVLLNRMPQALAGGAPSLAAAVPKAVPPSRTTGFGFPLLGDLHYDRLEDHDMTWVGEEKPNDVHQIENYSRLTSQVMPGLFQEVKETVEARKQKGLATPFVLHVGDLVEGLAGSPELARKQSEQAAAFVRQADLGAPFLFIKGNHDVTGPGAEDAFNGTLLPFLKEQKASNPALVGQDPVNTSNYAFQHENALFCAFDAYQDSSLEWLEATLAGAKAQHIFVVIHPPVVPYGARADWIQFARPKDAARRERLLTCLGAHRAIVLGGHIHKYNLCSRKTPNGRFVQVAVSSVLSGARLEPKTMLDGIGQYTPDQISVEPHFSPATQEARRALLAAEAPFVEHFEYADAPGYAVISVQGDKVEAQFFCGLNNNLWITRDLTALLWA